MLHLKLSSRALISIIALLQFINFSHAAVQVTKTVSKTTTSKSSKSKTTKTTSSKPTTTTPTTTSKSTKSTSSKLPYTWRSGAARPGCPTYSPTASLASKTFSAGQSAATGYVNLYGGDVPYQVGSRNDDGEPIIFRTVNDSQIQMFKPGHYWMIVDNDGVVAYDELCKQGVRLHVDNFLNTTGSMAAASSSSEKQVLRRERQSESHGLMPRGGVNKDISIAWRFVDQCGARMVANVTSMHGTFKCDCLGDQVIDGQATFSEFDRAWYSDYYIPSVDPKVCSGRAANISSYFTSGSISKVFSSSGVGAAVARIGTQTTAESDAVPIIQSLGLSTDLSMVVNAIAVASGIQGAVKNLQFPKVLCDPASLGYHLELQADVLDYGTFTIDHQDGAFTANKAQEVVTLATKVQDPCPTIYPSSHAWAYGGCQAPGAASNSNSDPATVGCPTSPFDACKGLGQECGVSGNGCYCYSDYAGKPMCFSPRLLGDCSNRCSSHLDCPCGHKCSWHENCCDDATGGYSSCVLVGPCEFGNDWYDYYQGYYYERKRRDLLGNSSVDARQMFNFAPKGL